MLHGSLQPCAYPFVRTKSYYSDTITQHLFYLDLSVPRRTRVRDEWQVLIESDLKDMEWYDSEDSDDDDDDDEEDDDDSEMEEDE